MEQVLNAILNRQTIRSRVSAARGAVQDFCDHVFFRSHGEDLQASLSSQTELLLLLTDIRQLHQAFETTSSEVPTTGFRSFFTLGARRRQRDRGFGGEEQEGKCLLQIQSDDGIGVAGIADGDILADVKVEIAAAGGEHESAGNSGCPDDFILDQALDVLEHGVAVIAGFGECGVGVGTEQHGVGAVDTDEAQLA